MVITAPNNALGEFGLTTFSRPRPDPMIYLGGRVNVIQLQLFGGVAVHARLTSEPLSPSIRHPLALILPLGLNVLVSHADIVYNQRFKARSGWHEAHNLVSRWFESTPRHVDRPGSHVR